MFSSLVTATKTRYATLRGGDEADGDTEDDSHLSRVLRNYYTEKGQPFPPWLGGGPQQLQSGRVGQQQQGGINLRRANNSSGSNGPQPGVKTTLSDIWDKPPATQQQQPVSPGMQGQAAGQGAAGMNKMRFFRRDQQPSQQEPEPQNTAAQSSIRDRLWSNRTQPPSGRTPPPQSQAPQQNLGGQYGGGYDSGSMGRERSPARQPYSSSSSSNKPYVSATSPWQSDESSYGGGGSGGYSAYNGGSSGSGNAPAASGGSGFRRGPPAPGGGRIGLPTGPKMMRP